MPLITSAGFFFSRFCWVFFVASWQEFFWWLFKSEPSGTVDLKCASQNGGKDIIYKNGMFVEIVSLPHMSDWERKRRTMRFSVPTKTQLSNFLGTPGEDYFNGNPKSLNFYFLVIWWGKYFCFNLGNKLQNQGPPSAATSFNKRQHDWVVVSNIFYFHPYLGKISNLTNIFQMGWNHQPDDVCFLFLEPTQPGDNFCAIRQRKSRWSENEWRKNGVSDFFTNRKEAICPVATNILLMEEIPHNHLGSIKHCK